MLRNIHTIDILKRNRAQEIPIDVIVNNDPIAEQTFTMYTDNVYGLFFKQPSILLGGVFKLPSPFFYEESMKQKNKKNLPEYTQWKTVLIDSIECNLILFTLILHAHACRASMRAQLGALT